MIPLKTIFKFNKLLYTLLKRNDYVALYGIGGTAEKEAEKFEVFKIIIQSDESSAIEYVPSNSDSEISEGWLQCFNDYKSALNYFYYLTTWVELYQGVPKVVSGVENNAEIVLEYQLV